MVKLDFDKSDGLIPVITQDHKNNDVLMLAYMNVEAWEKTLKTGKATYWSRSRNQLWLKGESSGNFQIVKEIYIDCDLDTILLKVDQVGNAACHEGYKSCFFRKIDGENIKIVGEKIFDPKEKYGEKNE